MASVCFADTDNDGALSLDDLTLLIPHAGRLDTVVPRAGAVAAALPGVRDSTVAAPAAATTGITFTEKYFGKDGKGQVRYERFQELVRDVQDGALRLRWLSMKPDEQETVAMVSFGRHLISAAHDVPRQLGKSLLAVDPASRLSFADFAVFDEVLDSLEELEHRLEAVLTAHRKLDKAAFDAVVRELGGAAYASAPRGAAAVQLPAAAGAAATAAAAAAAGIPGEGSGSVVMDLLFGWLDKGGNGALSKRDVRALLPLLRQHKDSADAPPKPLALWQSVVLGGTSAAIAGTVVFPIDTVKSRLMNGQGSSILGIFKDIIAKQGLTGLYRGLPAQLVGIMPEKALKLSLYNALRTAMADPKTRHVTLLQEALAGAGTAVVQVAITNPYELCKIRQQTSQGQSITETVRELGLRGMTKGVSGCLLRDIPFNALYFSGYAFLKDTLKPGDGAPISPAGLMAAGLGAGLIAGAVTTPADVIKTRMQTDRSGDMATLGGTVRKMWAQEGYRGFVKGLGPRVMLIPPLFAITMTCFETLQRTWFPQTVASPGLRQLLPGHSRSEVVKHKLQRLEDTLASNEQ